MNWLRFSNPTADEADLAWLLAPVNETGRPLGYEHQVRSFRGQRRRADDPLDEVRLYRDPYGSNRLVGLHRGRPVVGMQVVKDADSDRPGIVANVYTVPDLRGMGLASKLLNVARANLGEVRHSEHLTEAGERFAARQP